MTDTHRSPAMLVMLAALFALGYASADPAPETLPSAVQSGSVVAVADGGAITVQFEAEAQTVRLYGVFVPRGVEATQFLRKRVGEGEVDVQLAPQVTWQKSDEPEGLIFARGVRRPELSLNVAAIAGGFGAVQEPRLARYSHVDVKAWEKHELEAAKANRGLWGREQSPLAEHHVKSMQSWESKSSPVLKYLLEMGLPGRVSQLSPQWQRVVEGGVEIAGARTGLDGKWKGRSCAAAFEGSRTGAVPPAELMDIPPWFRKVKTGMTKDQVILLAGRRPDYDRNARFMFRGRDDSMHAADELMKWKVAGGWLNVWLIKEKVPGPPPWKKAIPA